MLFKSGFWRLGLLGFASLTLFAMACSSGGKEAPTPVPVTATPDPLPHGAPLSRADIDTIAGLFSDNPLMGGQVAPRMYKWGNENAAIFLQFDKPKPAEAKAIQYMGLSVKGVFCAEAQPDKSFTHFDRLSSPSYGQGTPAPGEPGYWLTAVAVGAFKNDKGTNIKPGVDSDFAPTAAPACGANVPKADFAAPGAHKLNGDEIAKLGSFFNDPILTGGQVAPRLYRWISNDSALFLQFDRGNPGPGTGFNASQATSLRFLGLAVRGEFCKSDQPSADFPHFHRYNAPSYGEGHGGPPHERGVWLLWVATETFERQAQAVKPGVDRLNSVIPIEQSC